MTEEEDSLDNQLDSNGPGDNYRIIISSQILLEKLKLVGYEKGYVKGEKSRPIEKQTFSMNASSGEAFFSFVRLASWLIRQSGNTSFAMPTQVDDPNSTIANINAFLRTKGKGGDWSIARMKTGTGEEVIVALNQLCDIALDNMSFIFNRPIIRSDDQPDTDDEHDAHSSGEVSDVEPEAAMDEDDALLVDLSLPKTNNEPIQGVLKSDMRTAQGWKEEVDRVTPLLKIIIGNDKDWRVHMDKMVTIKGKMDQLKITLGSKMKELADGIEKSISVIESREKSLSLQMSNSLGRLKEKRDLLAERSESYKSVSGGIAQRNKTLESISDDIKQLKEHIESEEARSTDGAPLVKVRQSLLSLEEESIRLGVQCAVAEQVLLHSHLSDRLTHSTNPFDII